MTRLKDKYDDTAREEEALCKKKRNAKSKRSKQEGEGEGKERGSMKSAGVILNCRCHYSVCHRDHKFIHKHCQRRSFTAAGRAEK